MAALVVLNTGGGEGGGGTFKASPQGPTPHSYINFF